MMNENSYMTRSQSSKLKNAVQAPHEPELKSKCLKSKRSPSKKIPKESRQNLKNVEKEKVYKSLPNVEILKKSKKHNSSFETNSPAKNKRDKVNGTLDTSSPTKNMGHKVNGTLDMSSPTKNMGHKVNGTLDMSSPTKNKRHKVNCTSDAISSIQNEVHKVNSNSFCDKLNTCDTVEKTYKNDKLTVHCSVKEKVLSSASKAASKKKKSPHKVITPCDDHSNKAVGNLTKSDELKTKSNRAGDNTKPFVKDIEGIISHLVGQVENNFNLNISNSPSKAPHENAMKQDEKCNNRLESQSISTTCNGNVPLQKDSNHTKKVANIVSNIPSTTVRNGSVPLRKDSKNTIKSTNSVSNRESIEPSVSIPLEAFMSSFQKYKEMQCNKRTSNKKTSGQEEESKSSPKVIESHTQSLISKSLINESELNSDINVRGSCTSSVDFKLKELPSSMQVILPNSSLTSNHQECLPVIPLENKRLSTSVISENDLNSDKNVCCSNLETKLQDSHTLRKDFESKTLPSSTQVLSTNNSLTNNHKVCSETNISLPEESSKPKSNESRNIIQGSFNGDGAEDLDYEYDENDKVCSETNISSWEELNTPKSDESRNISQGSFNEGGADDNLDYECDKDVDEKTSNVSTEPILELNIDEYDSLLHFLPQNSETIAPSDVENKSSKRYTIPKINKQYGNEIDHHNKQNNKYNNQESGSFDSKDCPTSPRGKLMSNKVVTSNKNKLSVHNIPVELSQPSPVKEKIVKSPVHNGFDEETNFPSDLSNISEYHGQTNDQNVVGKCNITPTLADFPFINHDKIPTLSSSRASRENRLPESENDSEDEEEKERSFKRVRHDSKESTPTSSLTDASDNVLNSILQRHSRLFRRNSNLSSDGSLYSNKNKNSVDNVSTSSSQNISPYRQTNHVESSSDRSPFKLNLKGYCRHGEKCRMKTCKFEHIIPDEKQKEVNDAISCIQESCESRILNKAYDQVNTFLKRVPILEFTSRVLQLLIKACVQCEQTSLHEHIVKFESLLEEHRQIYTETCSDLIMICKTETRKLYSLALYIFKKCYERRITITKAAVSALHDIFAIDRTDWHKSIDLMLYQVETRCPLNMKLLKEAVKVTVCISDKANAELLKKLAYLLKSQLDKSETVKEFGCDLLYKFIDKCQELQVPEIDSINQINRLIKQYFGDRPVKPSTNDSYLSSFSPEFVAHPLMQKQKEFRKNSKFKMVKNSTKIVRSIESEDWGSVAEIFKACIRKHYYKTINFLFRKLICDPKKVCHYFSCFMSAVADDNEKIDSLPFHEKFVLQQIGSAILLVTYKRQCLNDSYKILCWLSNSGMNIFQLQRRTYNFRCMTSRGISDEKLFFPWEMKMIAVDICMKNDKPDGAFTLLLDFDWNVLTEEMGAEKCTEMALQRVELLLKISSTYLKGKHKNLSYCCDVVKSIVDSILHESHQSAMSQRILNGVGQIFYNYVATCLNENLTEKVEEFVEMTRSFTIFSNIKSLAMRGCLIKAIKDDETKKIQIIFNECCSFGVYPSMKKLPEFGKEKHQIILSTHCTKSELDLILKHVFKKLFEAFPPEASIQKWFNFCFKISESPLVNVPKGIVIAGMHDIPSEPEAFISRLKVVLDESNVLFEIKRNDDFIVRIDPNSLYGIYLNMKNGKAQGEPCEGGSSMFVNLVNNGHMFGSNSDLANCGSFEEISPKDHTGILKRSSTTPQKRKSLPQLPRELAGEKSDFFFSGNDSDCAEDYETPKKKVHFNNKHSVNVYDKLSSESSNHSNEELSDSNEANEEVSDCNEANEEVKDIPTQIHSLPKKSPNKLCENRLNNQQTCRKIFSRKNNEDSPSSSKIKNISVIIDPSAPKSPKKSTLQVIKNRNGLNIPEKDRNLKFTVSCNTLQRTPVKSPANDKDAERSEGELSTDDEDTPMYSGPNDLWKQGCSVNSNKVPLYSKSHSPSRHLGYNTGTVSSLNYNQLIREPRQMNNSATGRNLKRKSSLSPEMTHFSVKKRKLPLDFFSVKEDLLHVLKLKIKFRHKILTEEEINDQAHLLMEEFITEKAANSGVKNLSRWLNLLNDFAKKRQL